MMEISKTMARNILKLYVYNHAANAWEGVTLS